jgi:hypothetical protein
MKRKDNTVSLVGLQPEMRLVLKTVDSLWNKLGKEAVITAGTEACYPDGKFIHSAGSLHPFGFALDFRTNYFDPLTVEVIKKELKYVLNDDYDIVIHASHIHIELDKKN